MYILIISDSYTGIAHVHILEREYDESEMYDCLMELGYDPNSSAWVTAMELEDHRV